MCTLTCRCLCFNAAVVGVIEVSNLYDFILLRVEDLRLFRIYCSKILVSLPISFSIFQRGCFIKKHSLRVNTSTYISIDQLKFNAKADSIGPWLCFKSQ